MTSGILAVRTNMTRSEVLKRLKTGERLWIGFINGDDNSDGLVYRFDHCHHESHTRIQERTIDALERAGLIESYQDVDYNEEKDEVISIRCYFVARDNS